jgi:hypothetical protein
MALLILAVVAFLVALRRLDRRLDRRDVARGATAHTEYAARVRAERAAWDDIVHRLTREDRPR